MDFIRDILGIFSKYPDVAAAVVGITLSMLATQFIKKLLPDEWTDSKFKKVTQMIGFFTGWIFTHGAWILFDPTSSHFEQVYASAGCGFASPCVYSFVSQYVMHRYPWFDRVFSGRPQAPDVKPPEPTKTV